MTRRSLTKADKERSDKLRELGCIVCLNVLELYTPPAIHHLNGQAKPGCHQLTIPLCTMHHQVSCNTPAYPLWVSRHGDGRAAFEKEYGTELELLEQVNRMIGHETK